MVTGGGDPDPDPSVFASGNSLITAVANVDSVSVSLIPDPE